VLVSEVGDGPRSRLERLLKGRKRDRGRDGDIAVETTQITHLFELGVQLHLEVDLGVVLRIDRDASGEAEGNLKTDDDVEDRRRRDSGRPRT